MENTPLHSFLQTTSLNHPESISQHLKTSHSKNITIEEWNDVVNFLSNLARKDTETYRGFLSTINTLAKLPSIEEMQTYLADVRYVQNTVHTTASEAKYYSELAKRYSNVTLKTAKSFYVDTFNDLLNFAKFGQGSLYRMEGGVSVPYRPTELDTGDTIYIKELGVPDMWWVKTNTYDGAFEYEDEALAYPLREQRNFSECISKIEDVISLAKIPLIDKPVVASVEGDSLEPDYAWYLRFAGTAEDPYRIDTPAQLLGLSNLSNGMYDPTVLSESEATVKIFDGCYFVQTAHLDMGGIALTPIAWADTSNRNSRNYSRIYYDGRGYSISNFKQSGLRIGGLFGYIGSYAPEENKPNCYIKNLTLSNATISATNTAGAVVAVIRPGVDVVNCHTTDSVSVEISNIHTSEIGGIIGYINEWNDDEEYVGQRSTRVAYCTNRAQVTGSARIGGVVGYIQSAPKTIIEYCINYGTLIGKGNETNTAFIGGILGRQQGKSEVALVNTCVRYCANVGVEQGIGNAVTLCGGIIGHAYGYNSHYGADYGYPTYVLEYCYDTGSKIYDNVGTLTRYSLIANCTGKEALKQYRYCHGANPVDGLTYHGSKDYYSAESCSVVESTNDNFLDTYPGTICQLHPLESPTVEMQARLMALEKITGLVDCQFEIYNNKYNFKYGMTWQEFVDSNYSGDDFEIDNGRVYFYPYHNQVRWLVLNPSGNFSDFVLPSDTIVESTYEVYR